LRRGLSMTVGSIECGMENRGRSIGFVQGLGWMVRSFVRPTSPDEAIEVLRRVNNFLDEYDARIDDALAEGASVEDAVRVRGQVDRLRLSNLKVEALARDLRRTAP
jgi:hypothetical protein